MSQATRKVRPDATLRQLPEERQLAIYAQLEKTPYAEVRKSLKADGIDVGTTALADFYQFWSVELRFRKAEVQRLEVIARVQAEVPGIPLEQVEAYADAVFLTAAAAEGNVEDYTKIRKIRETSKRNSMESRKLKLLEAKAAKAEALEASLKEKKGKGGLSKETLDLIEGALGMLK